MRKFSRTLFVATALLSLPALSDGVQGGEADFRDPFWPVGYSPAKEPPPAPQKKAEAPAPAVQDAKPEEPPAPAEPEPDWRDALRQLRISGYAESGEKRSCVINGKTVSENEKISIVHGGFRYTWRLDRIAPQKSQMRFTRLAVARVPQN